MDHSMVDVSHKGTRLGARVCTPSVILRLNSRHRNPLKSYEDSHKLKAYCHKKLGCRPQEVLIYSIYMIRKSWFNEKEQEKGVLGTNRVHIKEWL